MVVRANKESSELGGHIASFQSAATLYDTGFMHFWHAANEAHGGDLIYFQGHSSPGIYARAFLEGRLSEEQLLNFRQEVGGKGLSSYPHPWLMPDFWQFPTVSMGLGPLMAIYQARFLRYLHGRGLADTAPRKVWVFCGDGEMDEPELLGAISLAGREKLDNLIFVINCNLQRLDGPVRGNGKIVQELEADFRGAGWNVIKCLWGSGWDALLAKDKEGKLRQLMEECVDGEYQDFKSKDGAYIRKNFFGRYPETAAMVEDWTDAEIWALTRGGHDPVKVYAAYKAAVDHKGQPTVILAKTVKGYGMGAAGEGQMIAHQAKKLGHDALKSFRDRFQIPVSDDRSRQGSVPALRRGQQGDEISARAPRGARRLSAVAPAQERTACRSAAFCFRRALESDRRGAGNLDHDGLRPDSDRALARQGSWARMSCRSFPTKAAPSAWRGCSGRSGSSARSASSIGRRTPISSCITARIRKGRSFRRASTSRARWPRSSPPGTSYSTSNVPMIPFYIYYSMFGFQRVGDLAWAAGDMRTRGF